MTLLTHLASLATIPLALALAHLWQLAVLALAAVWLLAPRRGWLAPRRGWLVQRRGVVTALIGAGALGVIAVLAGAPVA